MAGRRKYTQVDRDAAVGEVQALIRAGLSPHAAAKHVGTTRTIPVSTLKGWARTPAQPQLTRRVKAGLAFVGAGLVTALLTPVGQDVYAKATDRPGVSVSVQTGLTLDRARDSAPSEESEGQHQPAMFLFPPELGVSPEQAAPFIEVASETAFNDWATDRGAVPAYRSDFRFRILSNNDQPVWVRSVRAELFNGMSLPKKGWFVNRFWSPCGDGIEGVVAATIYLQPEGGTSPLVDYVGWPTTEGGALRPIKATQDTAAFIDVTVDPGEHYTEYGLRIDYEVDDKLATFQHGTPEQPLRLTAVMPGYAESYSPRVDDQGRPQRQPDPGPNDPYSC